MTVRDLKKGDFFTLKPYTDPKENQVYIRGDYDPASKKYDCGRFDDISISRSFTPDTEVFIDFTF